MSVVADLRATQAANPCRYGHIIFTICIVAYFFNKCYNYFAVRLSAEGGEIMGIPSLLRDLLISVIAGLIANAVFHVLIG